MIAQWIEQFLLHIRELDADKILVAALGSALAIIGIRILVSAGARFAKWLANAGKALIRIQNALQAVGPDSPGIWLASRSKFPKDYFERLQCSKPIITIANNKGGVGKTTVSGNLGAHFAIEQGERVLLIDFDFQGSLSSMMFNGRNPRPRGPRDLSRASELIESNSRAWLKSNAIPLHFPIKQEALAWGVPAFYDLARTENRVMVKWLLGEYKESDPRYWLAEILLSPIIQAEFDRIIIDAPPRQLTACIQALCASTHVLIPTVLDRLSAEAAENFLIGLNDQKELWPCLKVIGIIPTMTSTSLNSVHENDTLQYMADFLQRIPGKIELLPKSAFLADNKLLSRAAGLRIAYAENSNDRDHRDLRANIASIAHTINRKIAGEQWDEGRRIRATT